MEGLEIGKVKLLPHDRAWETEFARAKREIEAIWRSNLLDIQHVGSTAIRRIRAKPILDIAARLRDMRKMDVQSMKKLGYDYIGPRFGRDTYHLFIFRGEDRRSLRHVHCYQADDGEFDRMVGFRDYLNAHPDARRQYAGLKEALAARYPDDEAAYAEGKDAFILRIYALLDREPAGRPSA